MIEIFNVVKLRETENTSAQLIRRGYRYPNNY